MKTETRRMNVTKISVVLVCSLSSIGVATAFGQERREGREDHDRCIRIKATLTAVVPVTENCTSPVGMCFSSVIVGARLIRGTSFATVLGVAPSAGLPGIEPATTISVAGERLIMTSHGTLTFSLITAFDTARGEVAEINRVTGGTGTFKGATGTLWLTGSAPTISDFEGQLRGHICTTRQ